MRRIELEAVLYNYFGYKCFREGQKNIISDILKGKNVFATLPTGGGKSICYLLPGYILEGSVVIVSPLLSLMEDQVQQLRVLGEKRVVALNSFLTYEEKSTAINKLSNYKFIYVSPEILQSREVIEALKRLKISLFVVDEAHCISQWGHEFRTDYLKIKTVIHELSSPPCLALTATASKEVQKDIIRLLDIKDCVDHIHSIDRPNITLCIEKTKSYEDKIERLLEHVSNLEGPGIIYCTTRAWTEEIANYLKNNDYKRVAFYHGGLTTEERILIQKQFIEGQLNLICATNAFGMGINKKNIRYVIHFHYPLRIESYIQEIGRAGRDGKKSIALLLYNDEDMHLPRLLVNMELPDKSEIERLLFYFSKGESVTDSYIIDQLGISDVKWRFIKYHLEKLCVIKKGNFVSFDFEKVRDSLLSLINKRLIYKQQKLKEMETWITSSSCRRRDYLKLFEEEYVPRNITNQCCDYCGLDITFFYSKGRTEGNLQIGSWENELKKIFSISKSE